MIYDDHSILTNVEERQEIFECHLQYWDGQHQKLSIYNNNNMSKDTGATGNTGNLTEKFLQVISVEQNYSISYLHSPIKYLLQ